MSLQQKYPYIKSPYVGTLLYKHANLLNNDLYWLTVHADMAALRAEVASADVQVAAEQQC